MKKSTFYLLLLFLFISQFNLISAKAADWTDLFAYPSDSSPSGVALKSTSVSLLKFSLKSDGADVILNRLFLTESQKVGIKDFKLYLNNSNTSSGTATNPDFVLFDNLNIPLQQSITYNFEVKANTTEAISNNYELDLFSAVTEPITYTIGKGFPIYGNSLKFLPNLNISLVSDSPSGNGTNSNSTLVMKFKLAAENEDIIIQDILTSETGGLGSATNYKLVDNSTGIVLGSTENIGSGVYKFSSLNLKIIKYTEKILDIFADTNNTTGSYKSNVLSIVTSSQTIFNSLPLAGNLLNFPTHEVPAITFSNVKVTGYAPDSFSLEYDTNIADFNDVSVTATTECIDTNLNKVFCTSLGEHHTPILTVAPTHHKFYISKYDTMGTWLTGNKVYYQISSPQIAYPQGISQIYEYIIPAASTKLNISNFISEPGVDSIKITWQTDRPATSKIYIIPAAEINYPDKYAWAWSKAENLKFSDNNLTQNHQYTITGLTKGIKYALNIENYDSSNNYAQFLTTFTTLLQPAIPLYPPNKAFNPNPEFYTGLTPSPYLYAYLDPTDLNSDGTLTLTWTGSDPDNNPSQLTYDVYLGESKICSKISTTSCKTPVLMLDYYYKWVVFTYDPQNNTTISDYWAFKIFSEPPVKIINVSEGNTYLGDTKEIDATTNVSATCVLLYSTNSDLGNGREKEIPGTMTQILNPSTEAKYNYHFKLTGLDGKSTYYTRVRCNTKDLGDLSALNTLNPEGVSTPNTPTTTIPSSATTQFVQQEKSLVTSTNTTLVNRLNGYILLQVQNAGQAWYVDPKTDLKYYLPDGTAAYSALRKFGLGITNADLSKIPVGIESRFQDTDTDGDGLPDKLEEGLGTNPNNPDSDGDGYSDLTEVQTGYNPLGSGKLTFDTTLANRVKGKIVLQVQSKGEAWYINPKDGKRYYMKDGGAAYQIMRFLSLGITNSDLRTIPVGTL